jgi:anti-anti-sigma factor
MGIGTLLLSAKAISERGGKMVLSNPDANVTHILNIAGIDTVIPICHSLDKARAALFT